MPEERDFVVRAEVAEERASRSSHPLNPNSELFGTRLGSLTGLLRVRGNRLRVPPGRESFAYHCHYREEEWIYVLSGRGIAEVGDEEIEVGTGDFMGFPAPQEAHHLRNPSEAEDLVYLSGGEVLDVDVTEYPRLGKRVVRRGRDVEVYDVSDAGDFGSHGG